MKKIYLSLMTCLGFSISVMAQPVLNASNSNLVIGDSYNYDVLTTSLPAQGNAGANQTWNFSTLSPNTTSSSNATTAAGGQIPAANVKLTFANGGAYYYKTQTSDLTLMGVVANSVVFNYSDPEQFLSYPFQMNNTFTDTWNTTFVSGSTFYRVGTTTVTADGYGTVILPSGTYSNVLRVKMVQVYSDSLDGFGIAYDYINTMYYYYKPGNHQPILSISDLETTDFGGNTSSFYSTFYLKNIVNSIKDENNNELASLEIYPNPTNRIFNVNFKENKYENISFTLFDITGKIVPIQISNQGSNYSIQGNKFPTGVYQLAISSNNKVIATKKIQFVND